MGFAAEVWVQVCEEAEGKAVGHEVDPKKMANVRMIFEMLAGANACVLYRRSSSRAAF